MASPNSKHHKQAIIQTAIRLFRRQGYAATGLNEILKISKAPKGSLYYYFPAGKEELGAAAVTAASKTVLKTLEELERNTTSAEEFLNRYGKMLAGWIEMSRYADGCPISTTLLEMAPASEVISEAGREGFSSWKKVICRVFMRDGWAEEEALQNTTLTISTIQGALLLARVEQSPQPLYNISHLAKCLIK